MKSKIKEKNGITLIVLIITVILLLILVGVVLDIAVDGKLLDSSKSAVKETNDKAEQIQSDLDDVAETLRNSREAANTN